MRVGTSLVVGFIGLLGIADGAVITVPSPGINTIQDGIDASSSGDVIRVKAGLYEETVTIGVNQGGITLVGVGKVILDARPFAIANGPGLEVLGSGVTVKNITIRCAVTGAGGDGDGLFVDANDFNGSKIVVQHCEDDGIHVIGADVVLTDCRVEAVMGHGIHAESALGLVLKKCRIRGTGSGGIDAAGNDVRISGCTTSGTNDDAIVVSGANARIEKCRTEDSGSSGIEVDGSNAVIEHCRLLRTFGNVLLLDGNSGSIRKCTVVGTFGSAISATGIDVTIQSNTLRDVRNGIEIGAVIDAIVTANRVVNSNGRAVRVQNSSNVQVTENRFTGLLFGGIKFETSTLCVASDNVLKSGCLSTGVAVIDLAANGSVAFRNRIDGGTRDGIRVSADDVEVGDNIVRNCGEDGIDVDSGDACFIDGNVVLGCVGEGIENNGTNTTITNNVMKKNRTDLANDGTLDDVLGNVFTTGGTNEVPLIDF